MESIEVLHSAENADRKRLILSLAGAVVISAVGFGLILLLIAWLIPPWMMWQNKHHLSADIAAFLMYVLSLFAMIRAARKRRSAPKNRFNPKQTILPL
jgi:O-antigen/teichoic acid export membrane protein